MKEKIKIMKTRPEVTEEEIRSFMDFNALLRLKSDADFARRSRRIWNFFTGFAALAVVSLMVALPSVKRSGPVIPLADSTEAPTPLPHVESEGKLNAEEKQRRTIADAPGSAGQTEEAASKAPAHIADPGKPAATKTQETVVPSAYVQAEPIDGYPALYEYFDKHLVYPMEAVRDSVEGVVNVVFVINTAGKAKDITIENSLGMLFDKEVIRLIENMPLWKPASYNATPVQIKMSLPITFQIRKIQN